MINVCLHDTRNMFQICWRRKEEKRWDLLTYPPIKLRLNSLYMCIYIFKLIFGLQCQ